MSRFSAGRRQILKSALLGAAALAAPRPNASVAAANDDVSVDAFEGLLTARAGDRVELQTSAGLRTLDLAGSEVWLAGDVTPDRLRVGDDVLVRVRSGAVEKVRANLTRHLGKVTTSGSDTGLVLPDRGGTVVERFDLEIAEDARFVDWFSGLDIPRLDRIPDGSAVDVIGARAGDGPMTGTLVRLALPGAIPVERPDLTQLAPRIVRTSALGSCTWSLWGYATWFNCSTGAGRCGTCSTSNTSQLAWPALDSACDCCQWNCCDCSDGCRNQHHLSCGYSVSVNDMCGARTKSFSIVDCGPCQRTTGCESCIQDLCSPRCADCVNMFSAIVDLTKVSFAVWYDPNTRGCFSCEVQYTIPC